MATSGPQACSPGQRQSAPASLPGLRTSPFASGRAACLGWSAGLAELRSSDLRDVAYVHLRPVCATGRQDRLCLELSLVEAASTLVHARGPCAYTTVSALRVPQTISSADGASQADGRSPHQHRRRQASP